MATVESIAIRGEQALERLYAAADGISKALGVEPPIIPTEYRYSEELGTMQLEVVATWAEKLAVATGATAPDEPDDTADNVDYDALSDDELRDLINERGLDVPDDVSRDEMIEALIVGDEPEDAPQDYETLTKAELITEARGRGLSVDSQMNKAALIDALKTADDQDREIQD